MRRIRLAVVSTHPIQYYAPLFRALASSATVEPRVFYTWSQSADGPTYDSGFGRALQWDVPLLEGYEYEFVENIARRPGTERFWGIRNPALPSRIAQWRPDAILLYGWRFSSHMAVLRRFKGKIPLLFRGDSTLLDEQPAVRALLRRTMLRWVYGHVDAAIAVGQNNRDYYLEYGLRPAQIALAPHSVDVERFADPQGGHEQQASDWRRQLGVADDEPVVIYAGKFLRKKDPGLLLEAFSGAALAAHLVFFGGGELEAELRARANGHARVHFLPFQNQLAMPAVYRVGDLFVLPSRGPGETWGLAVNEAMASGRPVIASSKVGGARDLISPGVNGWTFQAGDAAELARTLGVALALGRAGLHRLGREAQRMSSGWSTQVTAAKIAAAVAAGVEAWRSRIH